ADTPARRASGALGRGALGPDGRGSPREPRGIRARDLDDVESAARRRRPAGGGPPRPRHDPESRGRRRHRGARDRPRDRRAVVRPPLTVPRAAWRDDRSMATEILRVRVKPGSAKGPLVMTGDD